MHKDELNSSLPPNSRTPMHNNYPNLSQTMCNELDSHLKETDDDIKKIIELSTYKNNKKKGGT